jgi:hypothetical protein
MIMSRDARTGAYWRVLARTGAYWRVLARTGAYSRVLALSHATRAFSRLLALTHTRLHFLAKGGAYLRPQECKDKLQAQLCSAEKR